MKDIIQEKIKSIFSKVLDIEDINASSDLIRDLGVESIDLLEIVISLEKEFGIKIDENKLYLKSFRFYIDEARQKGKNEIDYLKKNYPFLTEERIKELLHDYQNVIMPSIKIEDIASYVRWMLGKNNKKEKKHKKI